MSKIKKKDWIKEMIEREAVPKVMREETIKDFSARHNIDPSLYHYHRIKKDNQKKIVEMCLSYAKESLPEVLEKLGENAKAGKEKSIEMYLKFVTGLAETLNLNTEGITEAVKAQANKSIKEFLNGNSENITKRQQGDDKGSVPV